MRVDRIDGGEETLDGAQEAQRRADGAKLREAEAWPKRGSRALPSACHRYRQDRRRLRRAGGVEAEADERAQDHESLLAPGVSPIDEEPPAPVSDGDGCELWPRVRTA